jgi:F420-0:gamma-glutamyl ligase-like protein
MENFPPNPGKKIFIATRDGAYARFPIRTHLVTRDDDLISLVGRYAARHLEKNDLLFVSERIVAITQGRAWPIKDITPSRTARLLSRFVYKSPYGIGLGSPWTMELALREAGFARILLAALASLATKPFGIRGVFYLVAGHGLNAIDGPCSYTLPPYNDYAKLGPRDPDLVAKEIKERFGVETVIIDANDLGVTVLGKSSENLSENFCQEIFRDNPLGQSREQTPLAIVKKRG